MSKAFFKTSNNLFKIYSTFFITSKSMKTLYFYTFANLRCHMMHQRANHSETDFVTDDFRHDERSNARLL